MKRLEFLSQMRKGRARTIAMDIIGYTPEEFEEMSAYSPHLEKIKKEAQAIFSVKKFNLIQKDWFFDQSF